LADPKGSVPGYRHPHVVVQNNVFNGSRIGTVVVCALTSNVKRAAATTRSSKAVAFRTVLQYIKKKPVFVKAYLKNTLTLSLTSSYIRNIFVLHIENDMA
jgi:hypothetical protein